MGWGEAPYQKEILVEITGNLEGNNGIYTLTLQEIDPEDPTHIWWEWVGEGYGYLQYHGYNEGYSDVLGLGGPDGYWFQCADSNSPWETSFTGIPGDGNATVIYAPPKASNPVPINTAINVSKGTSTLSWTVF